jgi:hypothetical protein
VWFEEFGFLTLASMALIGFLTVLTLLLVRFPARLDTSPETSAPHAESEPELEPST